MRKQQKQKRQYPHVCMLSDNIIVWTGFKCQNNKSFFYICTENKDTVSGAKRGHGDMEIVPSLTFLPDASHGAVAGCGSRIKQTLNTLFPKVYRVLSITCLCRLLFIVVGTTRTMFLFTKNWWASSKHSHTSPKCCKETPCSTPVSLSYDCYTFFLPHIMNFLSFANVADYSQCSEC